MRPSGFRFFFITNSPELAAYVVPRGIDRLMVDLEINGKEARQGHLSTVISRHSFGDVSAVRRAAPDGELMVRLNPLYDKSASEIETAIGLGSDVLMLPMFRTAAEVEEFCALVAGRNRICLLVETIGAMRALRDIVRIDGVSEIHIGLNDLHLELKNTFMFEPLANGSVDEMAAIIRESGLPFGIGGIARVGEGLLPAELILGEHFRLGSTAAIVSRTFHRNTSSPLEVKREMDFELEIRKLREAYSSYASANQDELEILHEKVQSLVSLITTKAPEG